MSSQSSRELIYFVSGMWCSTCAKTIHDAVSKIEGVASADLNYASKLLVVRSKPSHETTLDESVQTKVNRIGFGIKKQPEGWILSFQEKLQGEAENKIPWTSVTLVWFLAMWSSMVAFAGYLGGVTGHQAYLISLASSVFGLPAILLGILPYAKSGIRALRHSGLLTLDFFIFIGGCSAVVVSLISLVTGSHLTYADSGAMIVSILLLTKKIENSMVTASSAELLYQLNPRQNRIEVLKRGTWKAADVSQIKVGDRIRIAADETIPLDGVLGGSEGTINNHLLNGEADPVSLKPGDQVSAGAIAFTPLEIKVTAALGGRKIDAWAESALISGNQKSRIEKIVAKIESRIVKVAFAGALLIAGAAALRGSGARATIEAFFVGVLIFCPCLFASIFPIAKQITRSALMKAGVSLQSDDALWDLPQISNFYFDKTGTLECVESAFVPVEESDELRPYVNAIAVGSSHATLRGLTVKGAVAELATLQEQAGMGLVAKAKDGTEIIAGKPEFLRRNGFDVSGFDPTFSLVAIHGKIIGQILRKNGYDRQSLSFLENLAKRMPHAQITILSGDPDPNAGAAYTPPNGRISYEGNLSPEEKASHIKPNSAFVGDGLNDTLALAKSKVGFRLGHRVQNFAPVDIRLNTPNLDLVLTTIEYAKKFRAVAIQTACCALVYNAVALTLAAFGKFSPLGAVIAMLSSFSLMLASVWRLRKVEVVRS